MCVILSAKVDPTNKISVHKHFIEQILDYYSPPWGILKSYHAFSATNLLRFIPACKQT